MFYRNLDRSVTDNKLFWKIIKPSFSDKVSNNENINLIENEEIISDENKICEIFNDYFGNIIANLKISQNENVQYVETKGLSDPVLIAIETYEQHPSIVAIKSTLSADESFSFTHIKDT